MLYELGGAVEPGVATLIIMDGDALKPSNDNPARGVTGHEKAFFKAMGRLPESHKDVGTGFGFNNKRDRSKPRALTYDSFTFNASGQKAISPKLDRALMLFTYFHDVVRSASAPERELIERCWAVYEKGPSADGTFPCFSLKATGEALYEYDPNDGTRRQKAARLGMGAFGVTYRMRRRTDGQRFAVKMMDMDRVSSLKVCFQHKREEAVPRAMDSPLASAEPARARR